MGITDVQQFAQLRKMQGETNDYMRTLIAEQKRTNQLLEWVGTLIVERMPRPLVQQDS